MAASPLEKASADLKMARFVIHQLGETFDSFQVHSCSILSLAEQWRNLKASFANVNMSLENRVKELEIKERENGLVANKLQNVQKEIELKRRTLEFGEKSLSERMAELELRQNEVKEWLGVIEVQKRGILECKKAIEAKERELEEGLKRVKKVDEDEVRVRKFELEVNERKNAIEMKERELEEGLERVKKVNEEEVRVRKFELEVNERWNKRKKAIEVKERELEEGLERVKKVNEEEVRVRKFELEVNERWNKRKKAIEVKERELEEGLERVKKINEEKVRVRKFELEVNERWNECKKAIEVKERELEEGLERVKKVNEEEVRVRKFELEVNERWNVVQLEESRVSKVVEELGSREKQIEERGKAVESREIRVDEWCKAVELRENRVGELHKELELRECQIKEREKVVKGREVSLNERIFVMEAREKQLKKDHEALDSREHDMDKLYSSLDSMESEIKERSKVVESREKELKLREEEMTEQRELLVSKEKVIVERLNVYKAREKDTLERLNVCKAREKDTVERLNVCKVKEKELRDGWRVLREKEKGISERFERLGGREKEIDKRNRDLELKEKQVNAQCKAVEVKEGVLNEQWEQLELKGKEVDARGTAMELKEKEVENLRQEVELKERRLNEGLQGLESKQEQEDEFFLLEMEMEKKETNEHPKEMEMITKQLNRRKKAQELRENQFEDLRKGLDLKEQEVNERCRMLEQKENNFNELSQELVAKESKIFDLSQALKSKEKQINELTQAITLKESQREEHVACESGKVQELKDKEMNVLRKATETTVKSDNQHTGTQELNGECLKVCSNNMSLKGKQLANETRQLKSNQTFQIGDIEHKSHEKQIMESQSVVNDIARNCEPVRKQWPNCDSNLTVSSNGREGGASMFCAMDGKTLQLYLNDRFNSHKSLRKKVYKVLKSTTDPAKLVLDAIYGFFPPHLSKDGVAYEASVVRSSCLLLLEQLMFINPEVSKPLKKEATKVAIKWRAKMRVQGESEAVGVAFLLLLITYKLYYLVSRADLWKLCGIIDQHRLAPGLRQRLRLFERPNVGNSLEDAINEPIQPNNLQVATALDSSSVNISSEIHSLCINMDGPGVRSYLIEHVEEYRVLHDKILDALRYASDPAKLVLDVCQISVSYPDENRGDVNSSTCIFLLEQLSKLSPPISFEVRFMANCLASFLKDRLNGSKNPVDHYRFLQFIASYELASFYDPDELLSSFKIFYWGPGVYRREENPHLCSALGLANKIPGIIKTLLSRQKLLAAVNYICAFKLQRSFAPVPLLKAYLQGVKNKVYRKRKEGTSEAKFADNMESNALKNILTCISDFKLKSNLPVDSFAARLKVLERGKESRMGVQSVRKRSASPSPLETPLQQEKRPRVETVEQCQTAAPVQQCQPAVPVPQCKPLAPVRQYQPAGPVQQYQPAGPVQQYQPATPVQQYQPVAPSYLPPCPQGPPPRPHSFGTQAYIRPMSNGPNLHFGSPGGGPVAAPFVAPGHFIRPAPAVMYPHGAPKPVCGVNDHAWRTPNQGVL